MTRASKALALSKLRSYQKGDRVYAFFRAEPGAAMEWHACVFLTGGRVNGIVRYKPKSTMPHRIVLLENIRHASVGRPK